MKKVLSLMLISTLIMSCQKDELETTQTQPNPQPPTNTTYQCGGAYTTRVGAICKDGTRSSATGTGACSGHGGVNYWLCN
jgi:hypothetical protein